MMIENELVNFLKDKEKNHVFYDGKYFIKNKKNHLTYIYCDLRELNFSTKAEDLVFILDEKHKLLFIMNCLYCSYLHDAYWRLDLALGYKEVILDHNTLVRIDNFVHELSLEDLKILKENKAIELIFENIISSYLDKLLRPITP